jgi:hypothetical protein
MRGYRVMTAVGERVGRIVGGEGDYDIVKRSFGRGRYPLPRRDAVVDSKRRRALMRVPRKKLFEAPWVRRNGELDPRQMRTTAAERFGRLRPPLVLAVAVVRTRREQGG